VNSKRIFATAHSYIFRRYYSSIHALFKQTCTIQANMHYSSIHALFKHTCTIQANMHYSSIHALFKHTCTYSTYWR